MTTRSNGKPSAAERYWPHFAAGWDGNEQTPIRCADCGEPSYVGRSPYDPEAANVAHLNAPDQTWTYVQVCCRTCNNEHGNDPQPHLTPLTRTPETVRRSKEFHAARQRATGAEHARRARLRRARMAASQGPP